MNNTRLIWADSLKGWLMLLVIVGHAIQSVMGEECENNHVWNIIYSFHMPAFIAISGWLIYKSDTPKVEVRLLIVRRIRQLLIPYFIWSLISFLFKGLYTIEDFANIMISPHKYYWFLWALFFINVLFIIAKWGAEKIRVDEIILYALFFLILSALMCFFNFRLFGFQFIAYYYVFYIIGYLIHRFSNLLQIPSFYGVALLLVWFVLAWNWNMHSLPVWFPTLSNSLTILVSYFYRGVTAFIAIVIILYFTPKFLNEGSVNYVMAKFGVFSLGVYVIHLQIISIIIRLLRSISPTFCSVMEIILGTIFVSIISCIIIKIILRKRYLAELLLGKIV